MGHMVENDFIICIWRSDGGTGELTIIACIKRIWMGKRYSEGTWQYLRDRKSVV